MNIKKKEKSILIHGGEISYLFINRITIEIYCNQLFPIKKFNQSKIQYSELKPILELKRLD